MPTYAYACTECSHEFDAVQSFSDSSLTDCPQCQGRLRKKFGAVGVVFKGSGFYRTDSRNGSGSPASSSSDKGSSDKGSSDKGSSDKTAADKGSSSSGDKAGAKASGDKAAGSSAGSSSGTSSGSGTSAA